MDKNEISVTEWELGYRVFFPISGYRFVPAHETETLQGFRSSQCQYAQRRRIKGPLGWRDQILLYYGAREWWFICRDFQDPKQSGGSMKEAKDAADAAAFAFLRLEPETSLDRLDNILYTDGARCEEAIFVNQIREGGEIHHLLMVNILKRKEPDAIRRLVRRFSQGREDTWNPNEETLKAFFNFLKKEGELHGVAAEEFL